MPDMLVKLYDLPSLQPALDRQRARGIHIRRGMAPEKALTLPWIRERFSEYWVSEADVAFSHQPPTIMLAQRGEQLLGFACYDTTHKNFFGPTGVDEAERGQGIGAALLLAALHAMRGDGYMYGIIGWAGPTTYYEKIVGATIIPESEPPGSYRGMLGTDAVFNAGAPSGSYLER
ncbi:MAG: GNAT family N-acetyltransferase [Chloroflexi bacterium]|nr:GNAT family N-acetyltransferase [Chloroflexota bacterium]MDE2651486.1 GNAT family N-acetyltransferase [Chloroflexota bacterium]MXV92466.1 GNAT family N-acetyltransferase [Chloroflexota bacterium]MXX52046.1 GNAT family N-acetyltransferase [Chloroflexota bacterium]MXX82606.1 GNAT family N-acetyltransferase [Chloroflexota bacterium]